MDSQNIVFLFCIVFNTQQDFVLPSQIHLASNSYLGLFLSNKSYRSDLEINGSDLIINHTEENYIFICEGNSALEWTSTAEANGVLNLLENRHEKGKKFILELHIKLWGKSRGTITCTNINTNKNDSVSVNLYVNGVQGSGFVGNDEQLFLTDWSLLANKCQTVEIPCAVSHPRILPTFYSNVNQTWIESDYINYEPYTGFRKNVCLANNELAFQCRLPTENITITYETTKFYVTPNVTELFAFPGQEVTLECVGSNKSLISYTDSGNYSSKILMRSSEWFDSEMTLIKLKIKLEFKQNVTVNCEDSNNYRTWNIVFYNDENNFKHGFWQYQDDQSTFKCHVQNYNVKLKNTLCATVNECYLRRQNFKDIYNHVRERDSINQNVSGSFGMEMFGLFPFGSMECTAGTAQLFLPYFTGLNGLTYFVGIDDIPDEAIIAYKSMQVIKSKGQTTELIMCTYSQFVFMRHTMCYLKYENGTIGLLSVSNLADYTEEDVEFIKRQELRHIWYNVGRMIITPDMDEAICGGPLLSSGEWKNASYKFTANRRPKPLPTSNLPGIILGVTAVLSVTIISIVTVTKILRLRHKKTLNESDMNNFYNGNGATADKNKYLVEVNAIDYALGIPYNDFYELESEYLKYSFQNLIGKGEFGLVFSGSYLGKPVAIKTAKNNVDIELFKAALAELKMLMYVGFHKNIVKFVGAVTKNIQQLELEIVLELCGKGSLNSYLRKHVKHSTEKCHELQLLVQQIKWCIDITDALAYLFKRKIIHGDLATRNVLLDDNHTAKLSDFGLSAKSVSYSAYVKKSKKALLPWRWMAIESLTKHIFSTASDMWSFGVVVWEIFTLGELPYPAQNWDESFLEYLKQGMRLPKPHSCPDEIYEILRQCWDYDEKSRPNILKVREILDVLMQIKSWEAKIFTTTSK